MLRTLTENEFAQEYLIYKELSEGRQYKTYIAMKERPDGTPLTVVLKEMDEKRAAVYEVLADMWNPYVADTYDVFRVENTESSAKNRCIAVTEYVCADDSPTEETLTLTQFVSSCGVLYRKAALSVGIQICEGMREFHKRGYVHRDLKPDNIMISKYDPQNPQIKIVDFGGAKRLSVNSSSDTTVIGTLGYQAPESISSFTTNRADVFSIGCILNFVLTGQEPGLARYHEDHHVASVIEKATNDDPSSRYLNVTDLKKALEHELGLRLIDRIPILRELPGFRTNTLWKKYIAAFSYISMIFIAVIAVHLFGIEGLVQIFLFYVIVPLVFIFNMGNLLRFVPEGIRRNNQRFLLLRTAIVLFAVFAPIVVDSIAGR